VDESMKGAKAIVTYNSTIAYEAFRRGIPVFCNPQAVYARIASPQIIPLDVYDWDRVRIQAFLNRVAYAQWNYSETTAGDPIQFLSQYFQKSVGTGKIPAAREVIRHLTMENKELKEALHGLRVQCQSLESTNSVLQTRLVSKTKECDRMTAEADAQRKAEEKAARVKRAAKPKPSPGPKRTKRKKTTRGRKRVAA